MALTIEFGTRDRGLKAEQKRNARANKEIEQGHKDIAKAAAQAERAAKKAFKESQTAAQRYRAELKSLLRVRKEGRITQDQLIAGTKKARQEAEAYGKAGKNAFGSTAITSVASYATGLLGVSAAMQKITAEYGKQAELRNQASEFQRTTEGGMAKLATLRSTEPEIRKLMTGAKQFMTVAGMNEDAAGETMFRLTSATLENELPFFLRLQRSRMMGDIGGITESLAAVKTSFRGAGSSETVLSTVLGAAQDAPATPSELLIATTKSSAPAKALGTPFEDVAALTAVVSKASGEVGLGGTRTAAWMTAVAKSGQFEGMTIPEIVGEIKARGLNFKELSKLFGRKEAAFAQTQAEENMDKYVQARASAIFAREEGAIGKRIGIVEDIQELRTSRVTRVATQQARTKFATQFGGAAQVREAVQAVMESEMSPMQRLLKKPIESLFMTDEDKLRSLFVPGPRFTKQGGVPDTRMAEMLTPQLLGEVIRVFETNNTVGEEQLQTLRDIRDRAIEPPQATSEVKP